MMNSSTIEPDQWYVATPTNKLEEQMWGGEGLPQLDITSDDPGLKIRLASRVRKQRSGLGKFAIRKSWINRWLVLGGQKVFYFELADKTELELVGYPPWLDDIVAIYTDHQAQQHIQDKHKLPRGVFDLIEDEVLFEVTSQPSNCSSRNITSPASFSIDFQKTKGDQLEKWKVCFESEADCHKWQEALHDILGNQEDGIHDHGFEPGDHIIRWELIPIAWPIQIHGIVLEAGRNCVIIADFGMTAQVDGKAVKILEQEETDDKNNEELREAWSAFRPKDKQRLNVKVLTDKAELRKWTKVNYGRNAFSAGAKFGKLKKWFKRASVKATPDAQLVSESPTARIDWMDEALQCRTPDSSGRKGDFNTPIVTPPPVFSLDEIAPNANAVTQDSLLRSSLELKNGLDQEIGEGDKFPPESPKTESKEQTLDKLPKSDPTKIVLARTNFLLEFGEEILPKYHIFHSNSECIAVWCKTGRWSTLQAAIFLHSTALGNAKSATVMTIGVAASHLVLLPVLAVGGLAMVSVPWIILKRSKEKWELATNKLNDAFWAWAEPEVFVAAIENWSGLHTS